MDSLLLAAIAVLAAPALSAAGSVAPTVHIRNFAYVPARLTVTAGTTVRFVNDDSEAHTVTAASGRTFDSGGLDSGETWTHPFATPGAYGYLCALHPYMRGTIVVLPSSAASPVAMRRGGIVP